MESYFDLCICSFINLNAFVSCNSFQDFKMFWVHPLDILCSSITLIYLVLVILFPIYGFIMIHKNQKVLHRQQIKQNIGVFYEGMKLNSYYSTLYTVFFLCRRLLTAFILINLHEYPFFQGAFLLIFSTANLVYQVTEKPYSTKLENRIEIFNELCILLCSYVEITLLN